MRTLILNASPRREGNISRMLHAMADELRGAGAQVDYVDVYGLSVEPCRGCMACRERHACVLPDDGAQRVLELIDASDNLIIGSPVYWGNMPGTLKNVFDRIVYGLIDTNAGKLPVPLQKGKKAVIVATSTTPWPWNRLMHQTSGVVRAVRQILDPAGFRTVATVQIGGTRNRPLSDSDFKSARRAVRKL